MPDVAVPTVPPLANLPRVELVQTGRWAIASGEWQPSRKDLVQAVAALDCPAVRRPVLKLGHSSGDEPLWKGNPTGAPAVGWVDNLRLENAGHTLVGDFVGMPGWLGEVAASAYPDRSVEGRYDFRCQIGHTHPFVLTAVALLGVTPPGVGTLKSLQDVARLYGVTAVGGDGAVVAFNPGWKDQPRRKDRGLKDHPGRWVDDPGNGSTPDVGITPRSGSRGGDSGGRQPSRRSEARWLTAEQAQELQDRMLADDPWTHDQQAALWRYSEGGFEDANGMLRGTHAPGRFGAAYEREIRDFVRDTAAALRPLPEDVMVSRKTNPAAFGLDNADLETVRSLAGQTRQDPGFLSTTVQQHDDRPHGSIRMQIRVPAGTPAAYIESFTANPGEFEMVLAPGGQYRIAEVRETDDGPLLLMEVLP